GPARYTSASALPLNTLAADTQDNNWVRVNAYPGADGFIINGVIGASTQAQLQIVDTWTWSRRSHEWQTGIDFRQLTTSSRPPETRYTYSWANLGALLQGPPRFITIDHLLSARARLRTWA